VGINCKYRGYTVSWRYAGTRYKEDCNYRYLVLFWDTIVPGSTT